MRTIPRHHSEIHLPLFAWADTRHWQAPRLMRGYLVDCQSNVTPIWREVRS